MKPAVFVILLYSLTIPIGAMGQNQPPTIVGQLPLTVNEDQSFVIDLLYLRVVDPDDWFYPWGFSLELHPGDNYILQGNVVIPALNHFGTLQVRVTVNDGTASSNPYMFQVTVRPVNDKPVITGTTGPIEIKQGEPIAIQLSHLKVDDPDNAYPTDFTLRVMPGSRYTVSGNTITPTGQFTGTLQVNVRVNDGQLDSDVFSLPIEVRAVNRKPKIISQHTLETLEDVPRTITLEDLIVSDEDSPYPSGFSLHLSDGPHYSVEGTTLVPDSNYYGNLIVPTRVNDGTHMSDPYDLHVTVVAVNDPPIVKLESEPLAAGSAVSVLISETITLREVDGDSIVRVKVGFETGTYQPGADRLVYAGDDTMIQATYDQSLGVLMITGEAGPERYTTALRKVKYERVFPSSNANRVIYIIASDAESESVPAERVIQFQLSDVSLDIPSAFTPNGDAANDTWKIIPRQSQESFGEAHIRVYNRHGVMVFEAIGFDHEWDGRFNGELLPADTYFYTIDLKLNAPQGYISGSVTILR